MLLNRRSRSFWGAVFAVLALGVFAGCGDDDDSTVAPQQNRSPVITAVTVTPASVQAGGTANVTVLATDPDGDALTYSYVPNGGSITGLGASVSWIAPSPSASGTFSVAVTVSDGKGGQAQQSGSLYVEVPVAQTGIRGTIVAPAGVQVDLRNMLIRLYNDINGYLADAPDITTTAQGAEFSVQFSFINNIPPGTYYLDCWKDMDNSGSYTAGDVWSVYATGQWPNWTVAQVIVVQGRVTDCSNGMVTFLL